MPLVTEEELTIDVSDEGTGPPVVAVHSSGMSKRQWARLESELSARHRVIRMNLLGYGESGPWKDDGSFTIDDDVRAVLAVLATSGEPAHLVGHSYGGLVALRAAMRRPASVRSLALYEPVAYAVLHATNDAEALADLARIDVALGDATGGSEPWLTAFVDYWSGPGAWGKLPASSRAEFMRMGRKVFAEVASLLEDRTPLEALAVLTMPTLLLGGETSPLAIRHVCATIAKTLPRARVVEIPGAGHMGPLTHGDAVNRAIAAHVST